MKLLFFKKFGDIKKHGFCSVLCIADVHYPCIIFPDLTWLFVEMGKFNIALDNLKGVRRCIIRTIKHSETLRRKDVLTLVEKEGYIVAELIDAIYAKSKDREFVGSLRKFRLMDRDDGIIAQEFEKIGMLKGEKTAKSEIAKALLASGLAQDFVAQSTGLSPQDIAKLAEEVESSPA